MAASESHVPGLYADALAASEARGPVVSRQLFRQATVVTEMVADFLTVAIAVISSYRVQLFFGATVPCPMRKVAAIAMLAGVFAVVLLQRNRAFDGDASLLRIRETERAVRTSLESLMLVLLTIVLLRSEFPRSAMILALGVTPLLLVAEKQMFSLILERLHARGYGIDRVVVYGAGETGKQVVSTLLYSPRLGLRPVGLVGDAAATAGEALFELGYRRSRIVPVQSGPLTPSLLQSFGSCLLLVVLPSGSSDELSGVMHVAKQAGTPLALISKSLRPGRSREASIEVDGWHLDIPMEPRVQWQNVVVKRAFDLVVSAMLLMVFAPLLLLIAVMIRIGSTGPALFVQNRVGKDGEPFKIFKFRSMFVGTSRYDVSPTESSDPRITRLGRFLRRTSLDELPQLINVFLGDMSLVGPRPEMPFIVDRYGDQHRRRLEVMPGITGLWQLSADRALPIHENIEYDLYYIRNRTFFMDVAILLHTLLFAVGGGV